MTRFLPGLVALMACTVSTTNAATLTVNHNGDNLTPNNALCTLREAIANAVNNNNNFPECGAGTGDDVIEFNGSYVINLTDTLEVDGGGSLILNDSAANSIQLVGDDTFALLDISNIPAFTTRRLGFTHGYSNTVGTAGGLSVDAQTTVIDRPVFTANSGGAIARSWNGVGTGSLTINSAVPGGTCIFSSNSTSTSGAALAVDNTGVDHVTVNGCQINNHSADGSGGAIYFRVAGSPMGSSSLSIENSRLENNAALGGDGGAIKLLMQASDVSVDINDSALINNRASSDGGALMLDGGATNDQIALAVRRSSFVDNEAGYGQATGANYYGGAIAAYDTDLGVENSLFLRNLAKNRAGAIIVDAHSSSPIRTVNLLGNTFHENRIDGNLGPHTLELYPPLSASGWIWSATGNLFSRAGDGTDGIDECVVRNAGGDIELATAYNFSDESSCQLDPSGGVGPVNLILVANSNALDFQHPYLAYAGADSDANDFWSTFYCKDLGGSDLVEDLLGNARPKDFDGIDGPACDAGAFERGDLGTLTVTPNSSYGRIYAAPLGEAIGPGSDIDCGAACSQLYPGGTIVRLVYEANPGTYFAGWSGDCSGVSDCILVIDGNKAVGAFSPAPGQAYELDLTLDGDGQGRVDSSNRSGIACEPLCAASFLSGHEVRMDATPDEHSVFSGWSGCSSVINGQCRVTMSSDRMVQASFSATEFPVDVTVDGNGSGTVSSNVTGIDCPDTSCSAYFDRNLTIQLTAATNLGGGSFAGWSGDCSGISAVCELDMDGGPYSVTATFLLQNTLNVSVNGGGLVTSSPAGINCPGDCSQSYNSDVTVELTPNPAPDQLFIGWSGDCSGTGTCQVSMDAARNVTANFAGTSVFANGFE